MPVSNYDILSYIILQFGKYRGRKHDIVFGVQTDIVAVITSDDARLDILARTVWTGIHMGNKAHCRYFFVYIRRQGSIKIAIIIKVDIIKPYPFQFLFQISGEYQLFVCTRSGIGIFRRLGVKSHIMQEPVYYFHNVCVVCSNNCHFVC